MECGQVLCGKEAKIHLCYRCQRAIIKQEKELLLNVIIHKLITDVTRAHEEGDMSSSEFENWVTHFEETKKYVRGGNE